MRTFFSIVVFVLSVELVMYVALLILLHRSGGGAKAEQTADLKNRSALPTTANRRSQTGATTTSL